jgi:outer membrane protein TolC
VPDPGKGAPAPHRHAGPTYTLGQLIAESLRTHPTIVAAEAGARSSDELLTEARRAWWPNFSLEGMVLPSVDLYCTDAGANPTGQVQNSPVCLAAHGGGSNMNAITNPIQAWPTGALTRWELKMGMPIYTFGKLAAAKDAAQQGLDAAETRIDATKQDRAVDVTRAYYGLKVARELLDMVDEGEGHLDDAIKQVNEDLEKGKGSASETDRLRLVVAKSLVDSRALEAQKGEHVAFAALHTLVPTLPAEFDVDAAPITPVDLPERPVDSYIETARLHRPEARLVQSGVRAAHANLELNKSNFYPDIALAGSVFGLWTTTHDDDPLSPYMNHPFASHGYGGGLFFKMGLDFHLKIPRYDRAKDDYEAALAGSHAALDGMALEVRTAWETVAEAQKRMDILVKGEKASRSWLTAIAQNFAIGTAEAREFNDALIAYFDAHGRYLQAIYDYNVAVAWLGRLTGTPLIR